jgi:hypothetical protein
MYSDIICGFGCMCVTADAQEAQTDSAPDINSAYYLKCHKYHIIFGSDMVCLILKNSRPYNTLAIWIVVGWRTWRTYTYSHIIASEFSLVSFES